ncbi:MAG: thiamine diphosphokinase [Clostridiales Family XIII bacterium]|jgi:thiamine pyrophosphokinase|nr:thiamine diphosphokinase [Clostridiales Family XIII bacterium]
MGNGGQKKDRCVIITAQQADGRVPSGVLRDGDFIVCADGGQEFAREAGLIADAVVGDFDSSSPPDPAPGTQILTLPADKDETDTMASVRYGMSRGFEDFLILGGLSGRIDHTYANLQTLSYLTDMQCRARIVDGTARALMLDGVKKNVYQFLAGLETSAPMQEPADADAQPALPPEGDCGHLTLPYAEGCRFSVFSFEEQSLGVWITGARWPLENAVLTSSWPIGVSNEFLPGQAAEIYVRRGRLLILLTSNKE